MPGTGEEVEVQTRSRSPLRPCTGGRRWAEAGRSPGTALLAATALASDDVGLSLSRTQRSAVKVSTHVIHNAFEVQTARTRRPGRCSDASPRV